MLGLLPLVAAALVFAWGHQNGRHAAAQVPAPGLDFSMSVQGANGCDTRGGNAVCYLDPGSSFTVDFFLNSLPAGYPGYAGYDLFVKYTGISTNGEPTSTEWPGCGFPAHLAAPGVSVRWGCAIGVDASPSMYTGRLSTLQFTCTGAPSSGNTITLLHSRRDTGINSDSLGQSTEGDNTTEMLTINCSQPASPTPPAGAAGATATALPITGNAPELGGGNGTNTGLWVIMGLLAAAAVGAAGIWAGALRAAGSHGFDDKKEGSQR